MMLKKFDMFLKQRRNYGEAINTYADEIMKKLCHFTIKQ
jgi:hypothetical protein